MFFSDPKQHIDVLGLNPGEVVVDLGSGTGEYTKRAAHEVTSRGLVYAVDVHKDLLTRLKNDAEAHDVKNISIVWGDIESPNGIHLQNNIADAIMLCNTLFMIEDKASLMMLINRILKPHGRVLVVEWSDSHGGIGPHKDQVYAEEEAHTLFKDSGFTISSIDHTKSYHYRFVAKKTS